MTDKEIRTYSKNIKKKMNDVLCSIEHDKTYNSSEGETKWDRCEEKYNYMYDEMMEDLDKQFKFKDTIKYYIAKDDAISSIYTSRSKSGNLPKDFNIQEFVVFIDIKRAKHYKDTLKFIPKLLKHMKSERAKLKKFL